MPALSRDDSFDSSHRAARGSRKPWGGGPAGVAERSAVVERAALVAVERCGRGKRLVGLGIDDGRECAIDTRDLTVVMMMRRTVFTGEVGAMG